MSEEYATTRQDFLTATASYLGLDPEAISPYSELKTEDDWMVAVLYVRLKPSDIIGIGKRMQEIAAQNNEIVQVHTDPSSVPYPVPNHDELRKRYNALTQVERGAYGSFARYVADQDAKQAHEDMLATAANGRKVSHVDAPEEPEPTNMDAVWLQGEEATTAQRIHSVDWDENKGWLVQWAMLTDEQKQKAGKP